MATKQELQQQLNQLIISLNKTDYEINKLSGIVLEVDKEHSNNLIEVKKEVSPADIVKRNSLLAKRQLLQNQIADLRKAIRGMK